MGGSGPLGGVLLLQGDHLLHEGDLGLLLGLELGLEVSEGREYSCSVRGGGQGGRGRQFGHREETSTSRWEIKVNFDWARDTKVGVTSENELLVWHMEPIPREAQREACGSSKTNCMWLASLDMWLTAHVTMFWEPGLEHKYSILCSIEYLWLKLCVMMTVR